MTKKMTPRDTKLYQLLDERTIVYVGISKDVDRRTEQHKRDGRIHFTSSKEISPKLSRPSAERLETQKIQSYQSSHGGEGPKYNRRKLK